MLDKISQGQHFVNRFIKKSIQVLSRESKILADESTSAVRLFQLKDIIGVVVDDGTYRLRTPSCPSLQQLPANLLRHY